MGAGSGPADGNGLAGDGVNVAARLESLASPGGICVSDAVRAAVGDKLELAFEDMGEQQVKNISSPVHAWRVAKRSGAEPTDAGIEPGQEIRLCVGSDGTAIAYAIAGEGAPLLKSAHFMTHLEHDWNSPTFGPFFKAMASRFRFVRFDQRGNGLSDRAPDDISFDLFVDDLEAVADAAGLQRFPIYGLSQGASVAISYAVRHPERVSALILHGGYARGRYQRGKLSEDSEKAGRCLDHADTHGMGSGQSGISSDVQRDVHARRRSGSARFVQRHDAHRDRARCRGEDL
jgi:hypothetical protein